MLRHGAVKIDAIVFKAGDFLTKRRFGVAVGHMSKVRFFTNKDVKASVRFSQLARELTHVFRRDQSEVGQQVESRVCRVHSRCPIGLVGISRSLLFFLLLEFLPRVLKTFVILLHLLSAQEVPLGSRILVVDKG